MKITQIAIRCKVMSKYAYKYLHDLRNALQVEWNNILAHVIQRYINSITRLILEAIRQNAGHTSYKHHLRYFAIGYSEAKQRNRALATYVQSTLVISNSKGLSEILQDIRSSTYQVCRIEEKIIWLTTFNKLIGNWTFEVRDILKILWKRGEIAP